MGITIVASITMLMWLYFYYFYREPVEMPKSMIFIDTNIFYDMVRNKIIIKIPRKKSIFLPEQLRQNHHPIYLNKKIYQFYENYVMINHSDKILLK